MKFTATDLFRALALGSGKYIQIKAYVRLTSVLSDPLDSGVAWIDVTERIGVEEGESKLPIMWEKAEMTVGKKMFDSIHIQSNDIPFWRDTIFGACTASEQIEFKAEMKLGLSESKLATDVVYGLSGWIDKIPSWKERDGTVDITVISFDELGSRISAETLVAQILKSNIDLAGNNGLVMYNIPGCYVTDANITSYVLKKGIHVIEWKYNSGSPTLKLDDGDEVAIPETSGVITLTNGTASPAVAATEKVDVYVNLTEAFLTTDSSHDVIVTTEGNTLPNTWYQHISVFEMLKILYKKIGLINYSFDDFCIETYDDRKITSFFEVPPGGGGYVGVPRCLFWDHTPVVVDSYSESNEDATRKLYATLWTDLGHTFTGNGSKLSSVKFYLKKTGNPTGPVTAKLYAHAGTYGTTSGKGTGTALAVSTNSKDIATDITTSGQLIEFFFDETFTLENGTHYAIQVCYSGGDVNNCLLLGYDASSPTHAGCRTGKQANGTWTSYNTEDCIFYVYGLPSVSNKLWVGVGEDVYTRDMTTNEYTPLGTMSAGYQIAKFFPERLALGEMWGVAINATGEALLFCFNTSDNEYIVYYLTSRGDGDDIKYCGRNFAYVSGVGTNGSIFYVAEDTCLYKFDLLSHEEEKFSNWSYWSMSAVSWSDGTDYYIRKSDTGVVYRIYYTDAWHLEELNSGVPIENIVQACYNPSENKTILVTSPSVDFMPYGDNIQSLDHSTKAISTLYSNYNFFSLFYHSSKIYGISCDISGGIDQISYISSGSLNIIPGDDPFDFKGRLSDWALPYNGLTYDAFGDNYYGLTAQGQTLFKYSKTASMFIEIEADFEGQYVNDIIKKIIDGFLLVSVVSPDKKVVAFRRADVNGNAMTSGDTAVITVDETEDIQKDENYIRACTLFTVSNNRDDDTSWDGSEFNPGLLGDGVVSGIESEYIPSGLMKDFAVYGYNFFSKDLSMYTIPLANVALWQYECFDGLSVTFATTKIQKTATGVLYGVGIDPSGSTIFQVLL